MAEAVADRRPVRGTHPRPAPPSWSFKDRDQDPVLQKVLRPGHGHLFYADRDPFDDLKPLVTEILFPVM